MNDMFIKPKMNLDRLMGKVNPIILTAIITVMESEDTDKIHSVLLDSITSGNVKIKVNVGGINIKNNSIAKSVIIGVSMDTNSKKTKAKILREIRKINEFFKSYHEKVRREYERQYKSN